MTEPPRIPDSEAGSGCHPTRWIAQFIAVPAPSHRSHSGQSDLRATFTCVVRLSLLYLCLAVCMTSGSARPAGSFAEDIGTMESVVASSLQCIDDLSGSGAPDLAHMTDAQDDSAPSPAPAPGSADSRKRFPRVLWIAFTSAHPSPGERPPASFSFPS